MREQYLKEIAVNMRDLVVLVLDRYYYVTLNLWVTLSRELVNQLVTQSNFTVLSRKIFKIFLQQRAKLNGKEHFFVLKLSLETVDVTF